MPPGPDDDTRPDPARTEALRRTIAAAPALRRPLVAGDVVAERFEVERLAGSGGMGTVYRARDRQGAGESVALKVLSGAGDDAERFAREARVLAELRHPAVVRYVAHGVLADGQPWLAMEWLDGETLADRLARAPLGVAESLAILRRSAAGLAVAHARGIVHRDVKPSNLFLVDGEPAQLKLLDFGIARWAIAARAPLACSGAM
jgi:serine/threonine protein kinase